MKLLVSRIKGSEYLKIHFKHSDPLILLSILFSWFYF